MTDETPGGPPPEDAAPSSDPAGRVPGGPTGSEPPPGSRPAEGTAAAPRSGAPDGAQPRAKAPESRGPKGGAEGSAPDFAELSQAAQGGGQPAALALLYDLDLPVAIELGRTRLSVQDVLALSRGSVVQLDRQAGEPVDVYVGDRRFAEGEVVIVGEQFGVRITRIVNTAAVAAVAG